LVGHFVPIGGKGGAPLPFGNTLDEGAVPTVSPEEQASTPGDLNTLFTPFWEAWNLVHEDYVDQPVDDILLMQGAIRGMVNALGDEHSSYMDPETYKEANAGLSGEYEGIGAWVDTTADYLTVISPIPGSPAEEAGIKPGDKIIAIDGEDMTGIDAELVRQRVLGPAGTTVVLTIAREGESEALDIPITRTTIVIKSAAGKMLEDGIAYIQITTFGENTTPELRAVLDELIAQNPKGMIVDLRYNGGGFLQTSVEVASEFISEGVILYEQYGDGERTTYQALKNGRATEIPLVVLINEGTASASEIVAGAIQDYGRGKLVGVTSFGKGSVQNWVPLSNDQGAVRVTIAKWLTPNERTISGKGLTPDVEVEITDEDFAADRDPQLDYAIELLSNGAELVESSPKEENTQLPEFPVTAVELNYDEQNNSLTTDKNQIVYILDTEAKRWIPFVPDGVSENLPSNYELVKTSDGWKIRSETVEDLYTWNPDTLIWQPISTPSSSETPKETEVSFSCPLATPSQLNVNKKAEVVTNLNLRFSPGTGGNFLQTVLPGTIVDVMGGPQCVAQADGAYIWWQIKLPDGIVGWMAEASLNSETYFLKPVGE